MKKRSFWLVLLVFILGMALSGCACGRQKMEAEAAPPYSPPAVVQTTPRPAPVVVAEPPPKKDRN